MKQSRLIRKTTESVSTAAPWIGDELWEELHLQFKEVFGITEGSRSSDDVMFGLWGHEDLERFLDSSVTMQGSVEY